MKELNALKALLATPKKIVITTHANPDADALGSSLGLYHFLKNRGHEVKVVTPTAYPQFLHWMEGNEEVVVYSKEKKDQAQQLVANAELICCLDFSGLKRIKDLGPMVGSAAGKKLLVDHHLNPEEFADYALWDKTAAATAELIYDLILLLGDQSEITVGMAEALYAGIMTDTGSFRHNSTSAKIHRTVAELMDIGVDVNKVSRLIYDTNSLNRLRFIGYALMEKLMVDQENRVAYFVINAEEHQRFHLKSGDTEGLVNYALSIQGIEIAAIIMERDEEVKMSFRSVGDHAVNDFAAEHFSGGGHKNAAGGISDLGLEATVEKFKSLIPELQQNHKEAIK
ncbi:DHH family phosphoesterase [Marinoscillum furvescens]|uniref:Phosphoesterase RecJ-like protein n=1 Tax=Marinoscillum furvescens DSM 4134 TaxID=1122208 RepID=A0A3D9KXJ8_MARFU|nr:bifunctional oligoribonuclease/PAP phosphatase NrnA [Marinoscillum furvescens]RED93638.1 phosphoesterase RecJ-like protein [Marinoscillum furvescens DSM 4134]